MCCVFLHRPTRNRRNLVRKQSDAALVLRSYIRGQAKRLSARNLFAHCQIILEQIKARQELSMVSPKYRNARSINVSMPLVKKFSSKNSGPLTCPFRNVSRLKTVALLSAAKTDGRGLQREWTLMVLLSYLSLESEHALSMFISRGRDTALPINLGSHSPLIKSLLRMYCNVQKRLNGFYFQSPSK